MNQQGQSDFTLRINNEKYDLKMKQILDYYSDGKTFKNAFNLKDWKDHTTLDFNQYFDKKFSELKNVGLNFNSIIFPTTQDDENDNPRIIISEAGFDKIRDEINKIENFITRIKIVKNFGEYNRLLTQDIFYKKNTNQPNYENFTRCLETNANFAITGDVKGLEFIFSDFKLKFEDIINGMKKKYSKDIDFNKLTKDEYITNILQQIEEDKYENIDENDYIKNRSFYNANGFELLCDALTSNNNKALKLLLGDPEFNALANLLNLKTETEKQSFLDNFKKVLDEINKEKKKIAIYSFPKNINEAQNRSADFKNKEIFNDNNTELRKKFSTAIELAVKNEQKRQERLQRYLQDEYKTRTTSGHNNMCLLHSVFYDNVSDYNQLQCSNTDDILIKIKKLIQNEISEYAVLLKTLNTYNINNAGIKEQLNTNPSFFMLSSLIGQIHEMINNNKLPDCLYDYTSHINGNQSKPIINKDGELNKDRMKLFLTALDNVVKTGEQQLTAILPFIGAIKKQPILLIKSNPINPLYIESHDQMITEDDKKKTPILLDARNAGSNYGHYQAILTDAQFSKISKKKKNKRKENKRKEKIFTTEIEKKKDYLINDLINQQNDKNKDLIDKLLNTEYSIINIKKSNKTIFSVIIKDFDKNDKIIDNIQNKLASNFEKALNHSFNNLNSDQEAKIKADVFNFRQKLKNDNKSLQVPNFLKNLDLNDYKKELKKISAQFQKYNENQSDIMIMTDLSSERINETNKKVGCNKKVMPVGGRIYRYKAMLDKKIDKDNKINLSV